MVDFEDADLEWRHIWRTDHGSEERDDYLSTVLPRYKTDKHNIVRCTIDHLATANPSDADINLHFTTHIMGSILTECRSQRCRANEDGETCWCRYKINTCKVNKTTVVYQQGAHIMDDLAAPSPVRRRITPAMEELLKAELDRHPDATPLQLLGLLAFEISNTDLRGPEPSRGQVEYFLRLWRNNHPGADTRQVSSAIDGSLYDEVGLHKSSPRSVVYFSDTVRHGNRWVSRVGVGSDADPYRIGLTCYQLLDDYVQVQQDNESTVIVHLDSTFNTVKQKYPAFVIGYSDRCGHFFPMGYFCTSKRQNADVSWCLCFLQRALRESFNVEFKPTFIMMDGDKAQYKACANDLPSAKVLMCWYHVTSNVFKQAKSKGVDPEQTANLFIDLYDLHYAPEHVFHQLKTTILAKWSGFPVRSAAHKMGKYIKKSWLDSNFCDWQAFHTPRGCVSTNNPLEQYHKTYKIISNNPKASPLEMLNGMNASMQTFLATRQDYQSSSEASARLLQLYALLKPRQCLVATRLPSADGLPALLYRVEHTPLPPEEKDTLDGIKRVCSVNQVRVHLDGIPEGGWIVDVLSFSCSCLYHGKHGMCLHVLAAGFDAGVRVPGAAPPHRPFVSNITRPRRKSKQPYTSTRTEDDQSGRNTSSAESLNEDTATVEHDIRTSFPATQDEVREPASRVTNPSELPEQENQHGTARAPLRNKVGNDFILRLEGSSMTHHRPARHLLELDEQVEPPQGDYPTHSAVAASPVNFQVPPHRRSKRQRRLTQRAKESLVQSKRRRR